MAEDYGKKIGEIKVDGGASRNGFLMQFQSDISALTVKRPENAEATALGAALLAGLTCKFYESREKLMQSKDGISVFTPGIAEDTRQDLLSGWKQAIGSTMAFHKE